jgi:hypothetical protein
MYWDCATNVFNRETYKKRPEYYEANCYKSHEYWFPNLRGMSLYPLCVRWMLRSGGIDVFSIENSSILFSIVL